MPFYQHHRIKICYGNVRYQQSSEKKKKSVPASASPSLSSTPFIMDC